MNKTISKYISELLFLHDCVIIPEFGGFVGNNKSAVLNEITRTISPPSKEILFNLNLQTNDGYNNPTNQKESLILARI